MRRILVCGILQDGRNEGFLRGNDTACYRGGSYGGVISGPGCVKVRMEAYENQYLGNHGEYIR